MFNTFIDCSGTIATVGLYERERADAAMIGTWSMEQAGNIFSGDFDSNRVEAGRVEGTYTVSDGPVVDFACTNPDGTNHGSQGCYCASPGIFELFEVSDPLASNGQRAVLRDRARPLGDARFAR